MRNDEIRNKTFRKLGLHIQKLRAANETFGKHDVCIITTLQLSKKSPFEDVQEAFNIFVLAAFI